MKTAAGSTVKSFHGSSARYCEKFAPQEPTTPGLVSGHSAPKAFRVQLRRTKGWRLPANTVCVTRPHKWGNPFRIGRWFKSDPTSQPLYSHFRSAWKESQRCKKGYTQIRDKAGSVAWFKKFVSTNPRHFEELRGKNLACWCGMGQLCHADTLLRIANG